MECKLVREKGELALTVTSQTTPVTVTFAGHSASAEVGKPARAAVPLAAIFMADNTSELIETTMKHKEIAATITAGGTKVFDGKLVAWPGDLVQAFAAALLAAPPLPVAYGVPQPAGARRAALVMIMPKEINASVPEVRLVEPKPTTTIDEIDLLVTVEPGVNRRTIHCGWYQAKDGSKGVALDGEVSDARIRVVERVTGKVLGTTVMAGGGEACKQSVLEGSFTAGNAHVSIHGDDVADYLKKFLH